MKRKFITQKVSRSSRAPNTFDQNFWKNLGHEAKFQAAWEMVIEVSLFRGETDASQQRLQRSVQNIKRRKR